MQVRKQLPRLGTRKLYYLLEKDFKAEHLHIGRDKLFDLLREENLLVKRKRKCTITTNSKHWMRKYPNLIKGMSLEQPEQIWVADITYISTEEGTCYLHLVTDAYSKQIMGYNLSQDLSATSTIKALQKALNKRKYKTTIIHHSDRGLQYCSAAYVKLLNQNHCLISMTEDGSPYDNAIAERVNGILKNEFDLADTGSDMKQSRRQTSQSIELYNTQRPHLSCHFLTPDQMHQQNQMKLKAWKKKTAKSLKDLVGLTESL